MPVDEYRSRLFTEREYIGQCHKKCFGGNACYCRDDAEFPHSLHACKDKDCICHSRVYLDAARPPQPGERR